jgi:hypothetical protein
MFSPKIVDSDAFLDMPQSSQLLYFHLAMRADDDGFIGNPKKILRMMNGGDDDLKVLIAKRFILSFESGVVVIKHWLIHNLIRNDRYHETQYLDEKAMLDTKENGAYTELATNRQPNDNRLAPEVRLGKVRLGKENTVASAPTPAQEAKSFFEGGETFETIHGEFAEKVPAALLDSELKKFTLYWTEPNGTGTKVRWQQQPTFDVRRRLIGWLQRVKERAITRGRGLAE